MDSFERTEVRRALDDLKPFLAAFASQLRIPVADSTGQCGFH
ncbi:MAG: hypothetical protein NTW72_12230 [Gemmatimonadetes bacterium]|nr:hypothetical protein [Gemmatimonadota bacterium]